MGQREQDHEPYWSEDLAIGEAPIRGEQTTIRLSLHTTEEDYRGRDELLPLSARTGRRLYLHARAYVLEPQFSLTVDLHPESIPQGEIGEVIASEWEGMRHTQIGEAQAWGYPADRAAVLWECYLLEPFRAEDPTHDETLATLWTGFEHLVVERRLEVPPTKTRIAA